MIIQHNITAMLGKRQLGIITKDNSKSTEKLSSGYRINRSADDAAGLAISEKMRAQIRGLNRGSYNCTDGISLLQTADGALEEVHSILRRLKELSVQSANDTNIEAERNAIQDEADCLLMEIDKIGHTTEFNTRKLFTGGEIDIIGPSGNKVTVGNIPFKDINLKKVSLEDGPFTSTSPSSQIKLTAFLDEVYNAGESGCEWDLIYNNGGTSHSNFRITYKDDNGNPITYNRELNNMPVSNFQYDSTNNIYKRTFNYNIANNGISFEIEQKIQIFNDKNADYKYYDIGYTVKNTGSKDAKIDFMFNADTAYNNNDDCEGYFINGNRVKNFCIYTDNNQYSGAYVKGLNEADFSNGLSIVDVDAALPFSELLKWNTTGTGKPNTVSLGNWRLETGSWDYYDSLNTNLGGSALTIDRDLALSLIWSDREANKGSEQTFSLQYGIKEVKKDPNLKNVEIKMYKGTSVHAEYQDLWIQSGANTNGGSYITIGEMNTGVLGIKDLKMNTEKLAQQANSKIDDAVEIISKQRSRIGADHNRLEYARGVDDLTSENLQYAESRIRDQNIADGMVYYTMTNILIQAGQSMLAQANQASQGVLQLLQ